MVTRIGRHFLYTRHASLQAVIHISEFLTVHAHRGAGHRFQIRFVAKGGLPESNQLLRLGCWSRVFENRLSVPDFFLSQWNARED
jgi:hypothetical protein